MWDDKICEACESDNVVVYNRPISKTTKIDGKAYRQMYKPATCQDCGLDQRRVISNTPLCRNCG